MLPYCLHSRFYRIPCCQVAKTTRLPDPTIGRFLQRDPLGYVDSLNLHSYVRNDPINWVDPLGLQTDTYTNPGTSSPPDTGGGSTSTVKTLVWVAFLYTGYKYLQYRLRHHKKHRIAVIGRSSRRVERYAREYKAKYPNAKIELFNGLGNGPHDPPFDMLSDATLESNREWIRWIMSEQIEIHDIGYDPELGPDDLGDFYGMELEETGDYCKIKRINPGY